MNLLDLKKDTSKKPPIFETHLMSRRELFNFSFLPQETKKTECPRIWNQSVYKILFLSCCPPFQFNKNYFSNILVDLEVIKIPNCTKSGKENKSKPT